MQGNKNNEIKVKNSVDFLLLLLLLSFALFILLLFFLFIYCCYCNTVENADSPNPDSKPFLLSYVLNSTTRTGPLRKTPWALLVTTLCVTVRRDENIQKEDYMLMLCNPELIHSRK